ncbi:MAG: valine--tRNA ligase [Alphaproteobacteria bacterium]|nr:valine--tRNA ligase [Alphaproteobacteria bacterium]
MDKKYHAPTVEQKSRDVWKKHRIEHYQEPQKEKGTFTIMMPPANVTGSLHVGHALTFSLQDALMRFHRMQQKNILWQPGTDHAGIATQTRVIQDLTEKGINAHTLSREELLKHIWEWKHLYNDTILNQLKTLGTSAHWERTRFTMDTGLSHAVTTAFVRLHQQGLIFRKKTLVNWDTKLQTAISDLEILQKEQKGTLYHITYETEITPLTVATTRPETLFGDTALAVHPSDERYQNFIGKKAFIPIINKEIPIIADHHAQPDKGSGVVKITPAHDFNDHAVGKRHNLDSVNILNKDGSLNERTPAHYHNLSVFKARKQILQELASKNHIVQEESCNHTVPYGDRSNTVIEPFLTDQWFVDTKPMAEKSLIAFKKGDVQFFPSRWGKVFQQWLDNIEPWCISRQIYWGHRIPVWWGPDNHYFVAHSEQEAQEQAFTHYGKPTTLQQDNDVLDTWFSSGLWPFATLDWPTKTPHPEHFPSSVLVTGFDIIFFWVARMMMMSLQLTNTVPFRHVLIHGLIRDEKGQKMSKSKGNVVNPLSILEEYGADSLRLTLMYSASPGQDVRLSPQTIVSMRNFCTKIWNTARYAHMNNVSLIHAEPTPAHPLNQWVLHIINETTTAITKSLNTYGFQEAALTLYKAFWHFFCDWYIEGTKPLFAEEEYAPETYATFGFCLQRFLILLHPYAPHITEEIWQSFEQQNALALHPWPTAQNSTSEPASMQWFQDVVNQVRSYHKHLPSTDMVCALWSEDSEVKKQFSLFSSLFSHMCPLDVIWCDRSKAPLTLRVAVGKTSLFITAPHMDINNEQDLLHKKIKEIQAHTESLQNKINKQIKAPAETKDLWRNKVVSLQESIKAAQESLARFDAVRS